VGQNVTLPCRYRVDRESDITSMCWGRGSCPSSTCAQPILWTDGRGVTWRQSNRYQLEGDLTRGDVSLTIVNAAEADEGLYCCRVEIPGWFNDEKSHLEVVIERGFFIPAKTSTALPHTYPSERSSENSQSLRRMAQLEGTMQNMSTSVDQLREPESTKTAIYVGVCVVLLAILAGALVVSTRYFHNKQKLKTLQTESAVSLSSPEGGGIQRPLEARVRAEENIYTMD
uniref:Ig-like domain-containing protein n=1 Tax=Pelodiscus sinensis TaxID=13735 RepID=K7F8A3_PELSI